MAAFVLGSSKLGATALGADFRYQKYKVKIYDGTAWKTYRPIIINNLTVPTNALVDINDVPILTSTGEFILVDENTEGLTPEAIYADCIPHKAYIAIAPRNVYTADGNVVYLGVNQPVYIN